jgi:pimeloyl-ACP methyl ester carboxylesterase
MTGAFRMTHWPVQILAGACMAAALGCQNPTASQPPAADRTAAAAPAAPTVQVAPAAAAAPAAPAFDPLGNFETSLVFAPSRYPAGNWRPTGLAFEDAWFKAADGTRLHGWYVSHPEPRAVVLFCHGNAGNVALWADELRILHDRMGCAVLGFDYRGYGRSEGTPNEAGVLADARAARTWLAHRAGVAEREIVLMGRSLGGAVAVDLAIDGTRGLILESTFTSMPEVGHAMLPWLPVRTLMRTQLNSLAKIGKYHGPLLQSHGTADRLIPYAMGQKLFAAANQPKQFIAFRGGDHNDPQTDEYYTALDGFLGRLR